MRTRRELIAGAGCLSAAAILEGCSSPLNRTGSNSELIYWTGWSGHELESQERLIALYNRLHPAEPVRLVTQFNNTGTYQKVRIAFAGGATPDVMSCIWAEELAGYAARGVLTPLDDFLKRDARDVNRDFTPGVAAMLQAQGHSYGLAATTNAAFIIYNKGIFRESGLDPDHPPSTIEELDRAARACTRTNADGSLVRYGFRPTRLRHWAHVFGGSWYDPLSDRITANHPGNLAALQWMSSYSKQYDLRRVQALQSTFGGDDSANGPFFVGKVAMWATGEWCREFLHRYAPKLDWGWFALPAPHGGRERATVAGGSVFVIPQACKQKDRAWRFLSWITSEAQVARFCSEIGNVPPLMAAGNSALFQSDPLLKFAVDLTRSKNATASPTIPIWPTYAREISLVEEAAMVSGKDPTELLNGLQQRMEREHEETGKELMR